MLEILSRIANVVKNPKFDAFIEKLEHSEMPLPVTVGDCLLVSQMGYEVEVSDGRVRSLKKKKHSKRALK